jgi:hypothetical protein
MRSNQRRANRFCRHEYSVRGAKQTFSMRITVDGFAPKAVIGALDLKA